MKGENLASQTHQLRAMYFYANEAILCLMFEDQGTYTKLLGNHGVLYRFSVWRGVEALAFFLDAGFDDAV